MPKISEFFGIIIMMFYDDHNPPHFHVNYNEHNAIIEIETLSVLKGNLPKRALAMVLEWANLNRDALKENWERMENHETLEKIKPLDE